MVTYVAPRTRLPAGHLRAMPALALVDNRCLTVQRTKRSSNVLNEAPGLSSLVTGHGLTANEQNRQL